MPSTRCGLPQPRPHSPVVPLDPSADHSDQFTCFPGDLTRDTTPGVAPLCAATAQVARAGDGCPSRLTTTVAGPGSRWYPSTPGKSVPPGRPGHVSGPKNVCTPAAQRSLPRESPGFTGRLRYDHWPISAKRSCGASTWTATTTCVIRRCREHSNATWSPVSSACWRSRGSAPVPGRRLPATGSSAGALRNVKRGCPWW